MKTFISLHGSQKGIALILGLLLILMVTILGVSYLTFTSNNLMRADRDSRRMTAFYLAEAGIDYRIGVIDTYPMQNGDMSINNVLNDLCSGATGLVNVTMDSGSSKSGVITSTATYRGITETVRVRFGHNALGVWDNAIFAGGGQSGKQINGNVNIHGSVHILGEGDSYTDLNGNGVRDTAEPFADNNHNGKYDAGDTFTDLNGNGVWDTAEPYRDDNLNGKYDPPLSAADLATTLSGTAGILNNYSGIPSEWISGANPLIPPLQKLYFHGELVETLNAELRVKHGKVSLSGNATAGLPDMRGNSVKETLDGAYVTDGYGGNKGAANVYSDNGTSSGYDLDDTINFPSLLAPYTDPDTSTTYSSYENYLIANSLLVPSSVTSINSNTASFSYGDVNGANYISWDKSSGLLTVKGIIRFSGDLDMSQKKGTLTYDGKGTLFVQGNVRVHGYVLPQETFPIIDALGIISKGDIEFATGNGETDLQAMGAWFAQKSIISAKQSKFAGAYVSNYFDMGSNVPSIYLVPELSNNLPPGMPGSKKSAAAVKIMSWRRL